MPPNDLFWDQDVILIDPKEESSLSLQNKIIISDNNLSLKLVYSNIGIIALSEVKNHIDSKSDQLCLLLTYNLVQFLKQNEHIEEILLGSNTNTDL